MEEGGSPVKQKRMKGHMKSINNRIALSFSLLIAGILLIIVFSASALFTDRFMEQKNSLMQERTMMLSQEIDKKIDLYRQLVRSLKRDYLVSQFIKGTNEDYDMLHSRLGYLTSSTYGVQRVSLIDPSGRMIDTPESENFNRPLAELSGLEHFLRSGREEKFSAPHNFPSPTISPDYMQNNSLSYLSVVRDENFEVSGYVLMNVGRNYLFPSAQSLAHSLFDSTYIVSKSDGVIYRLGEWDPELEQESLKFAREGYFGETYRTVGDYTYYKQEVSTYPDWIMVGVASNAALKKDLMQLIWAVGLIGSLGILVVMVISRLISQKITRPIYNMKNAMAKFEQGEMPNKLEVTTRDELAYLVNGFNHMLDDINAFIDAVYHEQEEKKKAEVAALKFQLESLQSQINPHFLYNTLNTVSYLALKSRCVEIRMLIQSLNTLLRSTLSNQNEMVPIKKELEFLESYVKIQSYRYEEPVAVVYQVDEGALGCPIPKLLLQPLVENALLHGIYPRQGPGRILVSISSLDDSVEVSISDDGVGMDPQTLSRIRERHRGFNSVGLSNVDERLQLYYGEESKLTIESTKNIGTVISFTIPRESRYNESGG